MGIRIIALAYPPIAELFGVPNASQILRRFFRLILGYCTGPAIQQGNIPPGNHPPGLNGLQSEHPIDVCFISGSIGVLSSTDQHPATDHETLRPGKRQRYSSIWASSAYQSNSSQFLEEPMAQPKRFAGSTACSWRP